jgi:hypothetical protein
MTLADEARATVLALRGAAPQRAGIAVRTMVSVALPLAIGVAAGHPQSGAAASFGGLASLYVRSRPIVTARGSWPRWERAWRSRS